MLEKRRVASGRSDGGLLADARQEEAARRLDAARQERDSFRARFVAAERDRARLAAQLALVERVDAASVERPEWLAPPKRAKAEHHATLTMLLTDAHFDEVVDPAQVDGLNAYNREIAGLRLRRCFERAILLGRHYLGGVKYDGFALLLGGDMFSGNIHEELARTNADTLFGSLLHWIGPVVAGVGMLADEFKRVHVVGVPGNHGRQTQKPIAKNRATDNLDWLLYRLMQREMARDQRVTWDVPAAADAHVRVYDTKYLLTHGDQFRGGSGISGALAPLLLGSHRKTRRQAAAGRPYDYMVMGHWHQHIFLPSRGLIVGGCLKGYDEYAYVCQPVGTRVLTRDLRWVAAEKLASGDELWAFSEDSVAERGQPRPFRVWQAGEVLASHVEPRRVLRVRLESGRELFATPEHRWLARRRSGKPTRWVRASNLVGRRGGTWEIGRFLEPWEREESWSGGWVAAMFDAEGSFGWRHGQSNLTYTQNEGPTLERMRAELSARGYRWHETGKERTCKGLVVAGAMRDKLALLGAVGAERLISKIEPGNRLQTSDWDRVVDVSDGGIMDVVVIATTTGTYFADGYGSHNCNFEPEPAQQALWITTPERGITFSAPVFVQDRKAEGW